MSKLKCHLSQRSSSRNGVWLVRFHGNTPNDLKRPYFDILSRVRMFRGRLYCPLGDGTIFATFRHTEIIAKMGFILVYVMIVICD